MIKNISLVLLSVILLSSCFGIGESDTTTGLEEKILDSFTFSLPSNWGIVSARDEGIPTPTTGKLVLAATSPDIKNGFSNTLSIIEEDFPSNLSFETYLMTMKDSMKQDLYSFRLFEEAAMTFLDNTTSKVFVFDGQYNENTPVVRYIQTAQVCEKKIYIMTVAIDRTIEDYSKYIALLQTFACKQEK